MSCSVRSARKPSTLLASLTLTLLLLAMLALACAPAALAGAPVTVRVEGLNQTLLPQTVIHPVDSHHSPVWVHLSGANSVVWHDHRTHWIAGAIPAPDANGVIPLIPRWTVLLRVDGRDDESFACLKRQDDLAGFI